MSEEEYPLPKNPLNGGGPTLKLTPDLFPEIENYKLKDLEDYNVVYTFIEKMKENGERVKVRYRSSP